MFKAKSFVKIFPALFMIVFATALTDNVFAKARIDVFAAALADVLTAAETATLAAAVAGAAVPRLATIIVVLTTAIPTSTTMLPILLPHESPDSAHAKGPHCSIQLGHFCWQAVN